MGLFLELAWSVIFSFSVNYCVPVIFFSTPPGVSQNKKSPSHFVEIPALKIAWNKPRSAIREGVSYDAEFTLPLSQ
jgi:hypothetical protein